MIDYFGQGGVITLNCVLFSVLIIITLYFFLKFQFWSQKKSHILTALSVAGISIFLGFFYLLLHIYRIRENMLNNSKIYSVVYRHENLVELFSYWSVYPTVLSVLMAINLILTVIIFFRLRGLFLSDCITSR